MRRIKRIVTGILLNLYLGTLNFLLYPVLLLLLPSRIPERVMKLQGDITYRLGRRQREKVIDLLARKLPGDRSREEIERIARDYVRIQSSFFYYTLFVIRFHVRKWLDRFATYEGTEHLEASLKEGKGVILPTFHFNHPIASPGFLLFKGFRVTGYAVHPWDLNTPWVVKVNTWLGYNVGARKGPLEMAYRNHDGRSVYLRNLKRDGVFVVLIDIPLPGKKDLRPVRFLGEEFLFPSGIVDLIYETGSPVHIGYCVRDNEDWRKVRMVVTPRLAMTGEPDRDLQAIVNVLEASVIEHPEQWWGWARYERGTRAFHEARAARRAGIEEGEEHAQGKETQG